MPSGLRLGRITGIDIFADWSLLIIFVLITFSLGAGLFPSHHPEWSPALTWGTAFVAAVLFFASILAHELSHAIVGRAKGIEIRRITLFMFGGMAHMESEPRAWRSELWMALVGPITSLALGALFLLLGSLAASGVEVDPDNPDRAIAALGPAATLLFWLGPVNIGLGLFNLLPGFPLDGGRVLRAVIWGITGDLRRATRWAARMGQALGWILIACGIAMAFGFRIPIFGRGLAGGLWIALIGWFLSNAALMSYRRVLAEESLENVPVRRVMRTSFTAVRPDMPVSALVDDHIMRGDQRAFPVLEEDGRFVGLVCLDDIRKVRREGWDGTSVRDIMTPAAALTQVTPGEDASRAMSALARRQVDQLPVVENGQVRGLFRREDILKWLSLHPPQTP